MATVIEQTAAGRATRQAAVKVWDPFVRVFHWSLVSFFLIAWATADEWDRLHEIAGYAIAVLVGLRLVWGLIGTSHARFSDFIYRPSAVIGYLKDSLRLKAKRYLGHNPAGGAMVMLLLLSLSIAVTTGIMSTMDAYGGVEWLEELHEVTANMTIGMAFLHVTGVIVSSLQHRENLVRSMFSGWKRRED
ncbi:MAG: cytochrome b/b6 domain-containing protein [Alphaproteobacteria bacterium]